MAYEVDGCSRANVCSRVIEADGRCEVMSGGSLVILRRWEMDDSVVVCGGAISLLHFDCVRRSLLG